MPDRLTLEEAKAEIRGIASSTNRYESSNYNWAFIQGLLKACDILNRVHVPEPDEEGQALLWLIREKKKPICITDHGWEWQPFEDEDEWYPFNSPIDEAKNLGWGGGE